MKLMEIRYLDWANKEWAWFNSSGLINSQNLINDGLLSTCKNNGGLMVLDLLFVIFYNYYFRNNMDVQSRGSTGRVSVTIHYHQRQSLPCLCYSYC